MAESVGVRRLCLVAGIEGYSQHDKRAQAELQRRTTAALTATLKSANVAAERTWRRDRGDSRLILLPVGMRAAVTVPSLVRGLTDYLDLDRNRAPMLPLRLRVSIVPGVATRTQDGYAGYPVVTASRLAESAVVQDELNAQRAALFALIVSDDLYQDVFVHSAGETSAEGFRRVTIDIPGKQWREEAWVCGCGPGSPKPANGAVKGSGTTAISAIGALVESVGNVLDNPEVDTEVDKGEHDADNSHGEHDEVVEVSQYDAVDHDYAGYESDGYAYGESYDHQAEYTTEDYASFDSPPDSHEEPY